MLISKVLRATLWLALVCAPVWALASITVVGATSSSTGSSTASSLSITPLAAAARADVMLIQLTYDSASATVTGAGDGWTEITSVAQSNGNLQQKVYYQVRSNSEPSSYSWTFSSAVHATLILLDTRGTDTSVPINAYSAGTGSGTTITAPELGAQTANTLLVGFFGSAGASPTISSSSLTIPSGGSTTAGSGLAAGLGTSSFSSTGLSGVRTASGANANNIGQMVALTPAATASCFSDTFSRSTLGSDWSASASSGSFTPTINTTLSRLQLTQNVNSQATLATLQRLFPAAGNLVQVTFQHYAYPNGSGADGVVTIFSDAKVNPVAGGSGGSLGYAQYSGNIAGFAGGWLGVGLDEFGNFSAPTENRYLGPGAQSNSVTIRGPSNSFYSTGTASTYAAGYPYLTNNGGLSPALRSGTSASAGGGPGDYFRISIDSRVPGEQWVQVERSTDGGSTYSTTVPYFELMANLQSTFGNSTQLPSIPSNFWLSFSAGTGGATNIHEIANLQVCATRIVSSSPVINHFRFEIPSSMDTCQPATIKVTACTVASPGCTPLSGTDVYATLKPSGWVGGNSVTLINGQGTLQLAQTSSGTITPDVDRTKTIFPSMISSSTASDCVAPGNTNTTSTISCSIAVAQSTAGFGVTFPATSMQSCADSGNVTIKACNSSYNSTTKNLQYWYSYTDPTSGTLPMTLSTNTWTSYSTLSNATPSSATNPTTVSSAFNSSGQTTVRVKYADVGKVTLNVRDSAATTVTGSGSVIVAPAGFQITAIKDASGNSNPAAADANGSKFVSAGTAFKVTAQAINACSTPAVTPNFGKESTAEGILLVPSVPAALNLVDNPSLSVQTDFAFSSGVGTATVNWPEAGVVQLTPQLKSGSYMGTVSVTGTTSANIGRFYADHFDVSATAGCSAFTYDRQAFGTFTVTAKSSGGATLLNYSGVSSNSALRFARSASIVDGTGSGTMPAIAATSFSSGVATLTGTAATYTFNTNPTPPVTATLQATDADTATATGASAAMPIRSGRLRLLGAYGSNLLPLRVPLRAEYYAASGVWNTNTSDSCTTPAAANFALGNRAPSTLGSSVTSVVQRSAGAWDVVLAKPASAGMVDLVANVAGSTTAAAACLGSWSNGPDASSSAGLTHLLGTWCGSSPVYDPLVRVRFGTPNAPFVFLRERY